MPQWWPGCLCHYILRPAVTLTFDLKNLTRSPVGSRLVVHFASAAVTVDSSHMTASSSASWSRFSPPSNFVNGHVSTMWFMVCRWPQSQEGDWARDGVLEDCPRPRGRLEDKKLWPWPWPRPLRGLALALTSKTTGLSLGLYPSHCNQCVQCYEFLILYKIIKIMTVRVWTIKYLTL